MKPKILYGATLVVAMLLIFPAASKAQSVGKPSGNTLNFFNTNNAGGLLGHREAGTFGTFNTSDQWIGIGQPTVSTTSSTKVPAYGLRSQWQGQSGIFSLKSASGTVKDLVVEWGSNTSSKLKFNFITNLSNPSALTEVMTLTSAANVGIGVSSPFARLDIAASPTGFSSVTYGYRNTVSGSNFGLWGDLISLRNISSFVSYGVDARVSGSSTDMYGGYFQASNTSTSGSSETTGIFAGASGSGPNVWAGFFNGNVFVSGTITHASDRKFKENIQNLNKSDAVAKLMQLQPATYQYKKENGIEFANGTQYGFVAQEVEKIFPELVQDVSKRIYNETDENGNPDLERFKTLEFKSVNYTGMVPILTKAIQEHETTISSYKTELEALKKQNEELTEKFARLLTAIETNRRDLLKDVIETSETSLGQNEPNPFGQSTRITYTLAKSVKNATIQIYNLDGKKMGDYQLGADENELQIEANTFEPGVYIYALIADGKTIGTRRMIVSK